MCKQHSPETHSASRAVALESLIVVQSSCKLSCFDFHLQARLVCHRSWKLRI